MNKLRIAINAQVMPDGPAGGVVTVLRALAQLSELEDGSEEYVFVGPYDDPDWLRSVLPSGQPIVRGPKFMSPVAASPDRLEPLKQHLGPIRPLARGVKQFVSSILDGPDSRAGGASATGKSFFEGLGCDVIHFPFQLFTECSLPTVYNPHDLQHLHLPQFFTSEEIAIREKLYPVACHAAHTVVVASQAVKRDIVEHYDVPPAKVQVIPWAPPPLQPPLTEDITRRALEKYDLTRSRFVLYPAMTWEHKNHLRLVDAVAELRRTAEFDLRVVCTGFKTAFWPTIEKKVSELGLEEVIAFPGLVPVEELSVLYDAAKFVFVPTLFEAASAPVFEAWQHERPVACSAVTSLPEQVAGAALLFDPLCVNAIAEALARMANDSELREDLKRKGRLRLADFSLERTAKAYRAVYRRAAGRALSEEDCEVLGLHELQVAARNS